MTNEKRSIEVIKSLAQIETAATKFYGTWKNEIHTPPTNDDINEGARTLKEAIEAHPKNAKIA
jgi:hypothetical protein